MNKSEHQGIKNIATNYQLRKYLAKTTLEERAENDRRLRLMLAQNNIRLPRPTTRSTPRSTISSAVVTELNSIPSQYPPKIEDSLDILVTKTGKGNRKTRKTIRRGTRKKRERGLGKRRQTYIKKR